jgi:hypothetical protein
MLYVVIMLWYGWWYGVWVFVCRSMWWLDVDMDVCMYVCCILVNICGDMVVACGAWVEIRAVTPTTNFATRLQIDIGLRLCIYPLFSKSSLQESRELQAPTCFWRITDLSLNWVVKQRSITLIILVTLTRKIIRRWEKGL